MAYKQSFKTYRNIKGTYYMQWTCNPADFEACKKECKEASLKYRIINDTFYREAKILPEQHIN